MQPGITSKSRCSIKNKPVRCKPKYGAILLVIFQQLEVKRFVDSVVARVPCRELGKERPRISTQGVQKNSVAEEQQRLQLNVSRGGDIIVKQEGEAYQAH